VVVIFPLTRPVPLVVPVVALGLLNKLPVGFGSEVPNKLPLGLSPDMVGSSAANLKPSAGFSADSPVGGALLLILTIFLLAIASSLSISFASP